MDHGTKGSVRKTPAAVVKRDGARVAFDRSKIDSAIARAARAAGEFSARDAVRIGQRIARALAARAGAAVPIEEIQDAVELALLRAGQEHGTTRCRSSAPEAARARHWPVRRRRT